MSEPVEITYCFDFDSGKDITCKIQLDREKLNLISDEIVEPPEWVALSYHKCTNCPLSESDHKHCPVALNLVHIINKFSEIISHENISVSVMTEDRTYKKRTSVQEALSSLMGIVMVTSGCPVMDLMKPMARFHLPFSSPVETTIRTLSMYLGGQFFKNRADDTNTIPFKLDDLDHMYAKIKDVNNDFYTRISAAGRTDANLGALATLDCNATLVTITIGETLDELKQYYTAYL